MQTARKGKKNKHFEKATQIQSKTIRKSKKNSKKQKTIGKQKNQQK